MIVATYHFSAYTSGAGNMAALSRGFVMMMVAGGLFWLGLALHPPKISHSTCSQRVISGTDKRSYWLVLIVGCGLLFLLAEMNANQSGLDIPLPSPQVQFSMLCGGILLVTIGLVGNGWQISQVNPREVILVVGLTLPAAVLRLWELETTIQHFVDEVNFSSAVTRFWVDDQIGILEPVVLTSFSGVYPHMQNEATGIFGRNLVALRSVSALFGALTIPAVYLLGRAIFDRPTALLAALVLVTFPPHLQFSRFGLNNIADPLFGTLAIAFMVRGTQSGRRVDFVLAGVSLGLTQYFYEGGRLLFPALGLTWWGWTFATTPRKRRYLMMMALAFIVIALPVYYSFQTAESGIIPRSESTRLNLDLEYWQILDRAGEQDEHLRLHYMQPFLVYVHMAEMRTYYLRSGDDFSHRLIPVTYYYGGEHPLLLEYLVPGFLLGIFLVAWHWRRAGMVLLLLWVLLASIGNTQLHGGASAARFVVTFPALALLVAAGIRYPLSLLWPADMQKRLIFGMVLIIGILIGTGQTLYYFNAHVETFKQAVRRSEDGPDGQDAAFRAMDLPTGSHIYLISSPTYNVQVVQGVLDFYRDGLLVAAYTPDGFAIAVSEIVRTVGENDVAFFIEPRDRETLRLLNQYFVLSPPRHTSNPNVSPDEQFVEYRSHSLKQPQEQGADP